MRILPGEPYPLGATWDGEGVNFALFSEHAVGVELCLFEEPEDAEAFERIQMQGPSDNVWHVFLPEVHPGQLYGYRVDGPYKPRQGRRFNPAKLLFDPYAKAITGTVNWHASHFGYIPEHPQQDLSKDERDSAGHLPKSLVVDPEFDWGDDRPPMTPWNRTVIYECHVRGMTIQHPEVDEELRGTYLGMASKPILSHLRGLGVTAVELMPVHHRLTERHLHELGLTNYWGYNTIGYFAPDSRFSTGFMGDQVREFKMMVRELHRAGIEVILDVVYNHTGEGNRLGPTLEFRGIDNSSYYHLNPNDPRSYVDFTGTGNTLNMVNARTMQLMMDSLRYWVQEMHVDGFRFDLAPALARELYDVDRLGWFFDFIQQDPVLSQVKLIAEPWDLGPGGYQVGNFPTGWAEWNGRYRDTLRRFWRGDPGQLSELGYRLTGSSDLYSGGGRSPYASINFVTCHDGFTLADLVSYKQKHNEANGEDNQDGSDANFSRNWGHEGPTDEPDILRIREQMKRNLLASLAFSQGVPMISHGDEIGRTQGGNNNAYCQDNEISWMNWEFGPRERELLSYTQKVFKVRASNPVLRRRSFFTGMPLADDGVKEIVWLRPEGGEMAEGDWSDPQRQALGLLIHGEATDEVDERGRLMQGNTLLLLMNAGEVGLKFELPSLEGTTWNLLVDTTGSESDQGFENPAELAAHSIMLFAQGIS